MTIARTPHPITTDPDPTDGGRRGGALWLMLVVFVVGAFVTTTHAVSALTPWSLPGAELVALRIPFEFLELGGLAIAAALATTVTRSTPPASSAFGRAAWLLLVYRVAVVGLGFLLITVSAPLLFLGTIPAIVFMIGFVELVPVPRSVVLDAAVVIFGLIGTIAARSIPARIASLPPALVGLALGARDIGAWSILTGLGRAFSPPWH